MSYYGEKLKGAPLAKITTCLCQFNSSEFRRRGLVCGETRGMSQKEESRCQVCEQFYYVHSKQEVLTCSVYENIESY